MALSTGPSLGISPTPISPSGRSSCATNNQQNITRPPRIPAITTRFAIAPPPTNRPSLSLFRGFFVPLHLFLRRITTHLRHHFVHSSLHFLGRQYFNGSRQGPD